MRSSLPCCFALALALANWGCGGSTSTSVFNDPDAGGADDGVGDAAADGTSDGTSSDEGVNADGTASDGTSSDGACTGGATGMEACGRCGTRVRVCNTSGTWSEWSTCSGETGACVAGEMQSAACSDGGSRSRTCSATCQWGVYGSCVGATACASGATEQQACGTKCGKQVRVCNSGGTWSDWSMCGSEGICASGATESMACGVSGMQTRTCSGTCAWGAYGECSVGPVTGPELWLTTIAGTGSNAAGITLERIRISDETLVSTIALPTATVATQNLITLTGSVETEGQLTRSRDKRYLTLIGYTAPLSSASPNTSGYGRVIARIDASGVVDTTTTTSALNGTTSRAAITIDGSAHWIFGSGGTFRVTHGSNNAGTQINSDSSRHAQFVGDQMWISKWTSSGPNGIYAFSAPATAFSTPSFVIDTTAGSSSVALPCGMLAVSVAGLAVDRVYVADDRTPTTGGGLQVWQKSGSSWTLARTIAVGSGEAVRHVTGYVSAGVVKLYVTTSAASSTTGSRLVALTDDGVTTPTLRTIKSAPTNVRYRGVSLGAE